MRQFLNDSRGWHVSWRVDALGVCLAIALGVLLRVALFQNVGRGALVGLLVDPLTLPIMLALRPAFLSRRVAPTFSLQAILFSGLLCVGAAFVLTCWARIVTATIGWQVPSWENLQSWTVPWTYYVVVLASWGLAHSWVTAEIAAHEEKRRAMAAESEALKAELRHLRHQLDPHFLFNALNGIAVQIPDNPRAAEEMIRELARYLRYSLDQRDRTLTTLSSVLDAARAYLELEKARFGPELDYRLTADDASRQLMTPSFLLQPLVENAVKHGLKAGRTPVEVEVTARADGATLHISVVGAGTLQPDWQSAGKQGVGLSVLNRRLQLHYPDRHTFTLRQSGGTVTAELRLQGEPCSE